MTFYVQHQIIKLSHFINRREFQETGSGRTMSHGVELFNNLERLILGMLGLCLVLCLEIDSLGEFLGSSSFSWFEDPNPQAWRQWTETHCQLELSRRWLTCASNTFCWLSNPTVNAVAGIGNLCCSTEDFNALFILKFKTIISVKINEYQLNWWCIENQFAIKIVV